MKMNLIVILGFLCLSASTCKKTLDTGITPVPVTVKEASYRPVFHFAPGKNWINDPNGLVYYNGNYHLFFQYNPLGDTWGHMSWGHTISTNLMNWKEQPVALDEDKNPDGSVTMMFSGTAVMDSFNTSGFGSNGQAPLVAIYTSNVVKEMQLAQHQSLAYSFDGNTFTKFSGNPILDIGSKDFRDPKVFWHQPTSKWVMAVVKPDQYKVKFYNSSDLKTWNYLSEFGAIGNTSKIWECPDLFELPVSNAPAEKKWVITVSAGHRKAGSLAMQYFIGNFDGTTFTADPLPYPLYVDEGKDYYAGIIYNNLPSNDKRKIMIGWANSWEYANIIPTKGFRGMMAIPRELSLLKTGSGYQLVQKPVAELDQYHGELLLDQPLLTVKNEMYDTNLKGDALDIRFTLSRSAFKKAGISVLKNGPEETMIYFDKNENAVKVDRTRSGNTSFHNNFAGIESVSLTDDNSDINFRILVDKSLIEVFVNDGQRVITDQVFPTVANGGIHFFSDAAGTNFKNIRIWKMNPSVNQ